WEDHDLLRKAVCGFSLEWTPGSRVYYHGRAAHWVGAGMIEAVTKGDYRDFIRREITEPLGIADECFVGLPDAQHARAVDMHEPSPDGGRQVTRAEENNAEIRRAAPPRGAGEGTRAEENNAESRRAGAPGGGGYATARAMATFYQMMAHEGAVNGVRLLSPRMVSFVTRNFTGERVDG